MKELSIEEKAKRYDEAIERAKDLYDFYSGNPAQSQKFIDIFPELKESEDEKNIKDLIDELKCSLRGAKCQNDACRGGHEKRIALLEWSIAWLEKRGEKKSAEINNVCEFSTKTWIKIVDYVLTEHNGIGNYLTNPEVKDIAEKLQKKYKFDAASEEWDRVYRKGLDAGVNKGRAEALREQKPADNVEPKFKVGDKIRRKTPFSCDKDMQVVRIEKDYYICNHIGKFSSEVVPFSKQSSYELIEQKPAWSEEDEKMYATIIFILAGFMGNEDKIDWLQSLKDRVQPQPQNKQKDSAK